MLDKLPIGEKEDWEKDKPLKCELCGLEWGDELDDEDEEISNRESIEETGRCISCYEEWGDQYPDRI